MKRTTLFAAILFCLTSSSFAQQPQAEVAGIQVIRVKHGEGFSGLAPFNAQDKGTALSLLFKGKDMSIIDFNMDESLVAVFKDDKGTELLVEKTGFNKDGFGPFPKVSEDGKAALVEVRSKTVPTKEATKLTAKGMIVLKTASKTKTEKSAAVELKKGTKLKIGKLSFVIKDASKPSFGDDALSIELETKDKEIELVAATRFLDASGKELESQNAGSSSMGFNGNFTYGRSFTLKKLPKGKVVIAMDVYTDFAEKKVPFSVTAGIGG